MIADSVVVIQLPLWTVNRQRCIPAPPKLLLNWS